MHDERGPVDDGTGGALPGDGDAPPDLMESLRQLGDTGRAGFSATGDAFGALRALLAADVSLARSAFGRTLAFTGVAIAFGASAWLLLMAALIAFLALKLGLPWSLSLLLTGLLSAAVAAFGGIAAMRYFEHTRLQATRRQLARLGVGELAALVPGIGSAKSGKQATEELKADCDDNGKPKGEHGLEVTPP
ncbi:MAG: phage holin family protein [Pseudoxanthomonas suwonensis]|nr:phage holin family protein [Pseudoxanthomonas suwonensis]